MKIITAVIKPNRLEEVKAALEDLGVQGMTVSEASGYGHQAGQTEVYKGEEIILDLVPKVRVEVIVEDGERAAVVEAIAGGAQTGETEGDGKIWIQPIEEVVRIRTRERGADAL